MYRRTLQLPNGIGLVALARGRAGRGYHRLRAAAGGPHDLAPAVQRCRRLLDLDADPATVSAFLERSALLGPLARAPRVAGARPCGRGRLALRAVLGEQLSVAAARKLGTRLIEAYGKPLGAMSADGPKPG